MCLKYTTTKTVVFVQYMADGGYGPTGAYAVSRVVSACGGATGVATTRGRPEMAISVTATTSIMTFALEANVKVNYHTLLRHTHV